MENPVKRQALRSEIRAVSLASVTAIRRLLEVTTFFPAGLHHLEIERLVGHDPLQSPVLLLELLEPPSVRDLHPAVLPLPAMKRVVADSSPPAELTDLGSGLVLLQQPYDLLGRKSGLPHRPSSGEDRDYNWISYLVSGHAYVEITHS